MVGIVVVSHSRRLAEAAVELAAQMVTGEAPPIEVAAGGEAGVLGTDATAVSAALDSAGAAAGGDGVLVFMDLGSAVMSAEMALELRQGSHRVVLSEGPLVEGLVAAVVLAAAGAGLDEVAAEAAAAGGVKRALMAPQPVSGPTTAGPGTARAEPLRGAPPGGDGTAVEVVLTNEHGLHARPAALLVETVRGFDAAVSVSNLTSGAGPVSGRSLGGLSTLGAQRGHRLRVEATGPGATGALEAVSALVARDFDEQPVPERPPLPGPARAASPGLGIGPKRAVVPARPASRPAARGAADGEVGRREGIDAAAEHRRLEVALGRAREELAETRRRVAAMAGDREAAIFEAHLLLLDDDDELAAGAHGAIDRGERAADAWSDAVDALALRFTGLDDPYQRARAADVADVGQQVLAHLAGDGTTLAPVAPDLAGVVVARDLSAAQAAALDPGRVEGIVLAGGSPLSHAAILARSLGIPAVVGAGEPILAVPEGTLLVVDGTAGEVVVDPGPDEAAGYRARAATQRREAEALARAASQPAVTRDGVAVEVAANIRTAADAALAVRNGADAVGLLRTELLFLDRREAPGEEEQLAAYSEIAGALGGCRLTVRTLDAGADKPIPYLAATQTASALGCRGIRLSLDQPELFRVQLRALVALGRRHPVTVLFPMVTTLDELAQARRMLIEEAGGGLPAGMEVGAMVEVPAFALQARQAAAMVDLLSIGTNDLTQYTVAADRGDPAVAHLADAAHPAVLRLVSAVTDGAAGRVRVAVCGEAAADPDLTGILVGLGVRELSTNPPAIPAVKQAVRTIGAASAAGMAARALEAASAAEVRALAKGPPAPG